MFVKCDNDDSDTQKYCIGIGESELYATQENLYAYIETTKTNATTD